MTKPIAGNLHIANDALATLVANAAMECYGVVGMTSAAKQGVRVKILPESRQQQGVVIRDTDEGVAVELFVVIEYGTNISTVSQNLIDQIGFVLKEFAHVPLASVEVHVQDVRVKR